MQFYNENIDEQKLKNEYLKANSRCKYKTPEELQAIIEEYFGNAHKANRAYTISGLAIYLGLSTETLRRYENLYADTEYAEIIRVAKQRIEEYAENSLYDAKKSSGAKFVLENNFGWSGKQDVNLSGELTEKIVKLEDVL